MSIQLHVMDHHNFKGKDIPHIKLDPDMSIEDLVKIYSESGFNGRKLGEAAKVYAKMIKEDATICLTASGALTPVGFGGIFKTLIERGFVDWIVTTGANVANKNLNFLAVSGDGDTASIGIGQFIHAM